MARQRSILDRCDLYCPAPIISGQGSYGGVPREVYLIAVVACVAMLFLVMIVQVMGAGFGKWIWLFPFIIAVIYGGLLTRETNKRRDAIVVFRESLRLERKERRGRA